MANTPSSDDVHAMAGQLAPRVGTGDVVTNASVEHNMRIAVTQRTHERIAEAPLDRDFVKLRWKEHDRALKLIDKLAEYLT